MRLDKMGLDKMGLDKMGKLTMSASCNISFKRCENFDYRELYQTGGWFFSDVAPNLYTPLKRCENVILIITIEFNLTQFSGKDTPVNQTHAAPLKVQCSASVPKKCSISLPSCSKLSLLQGANLAVKCCE